MHIVCWLTQVCQHTVVVVVVVVPPQRIETQAQESMPLATMVVLGELGVWQKVQLLAYVQLHEQVDLSKRHTLAPRAPT